MGRSFLSAHDRLLDRAISAAENAALRMALTRPRPPAGAAALLDYLTTGPITGEADWHRTAFDTVVASLAEVEMTPTVRIMAA
jgi:hypothetical protein